MGGSSWYFLRYMDPHNPDALASPEALNYWAPVDWYNGGMEHTTLHLLYSRFWHKFLYDIGVVPTKEPYQKRTSHGMILGQNGEKMSKSRGNVVNRTRSWTSTVQTPCAFMRCSLAILKRLLPGTVTPLRAASAFWSGTGTCKPWSLRRRDLQQ